MSPSKLVPGFRSALIGCCVLAGALNSAPPNVIQGARHQVCGGYKEGAK